MAGTIQQVLRIAPELMAKRRRSLEILATGAQAAVTAATASLECDGRGPRGKYTKPGRITESFF
jgi:hypothetical protein